MKKIFWQFLFLMIILLMGIYTVITIIPVLMIYEFGSDNFSDKVERVVCYPLDKLTLIINKVEDKAGFKD